MDPRAAAIDDRLAGVRRIVAVTGSKGGIGKSVVSASLALAWADQGRRVGLFDLDFTSPSDHVILGAEEHFPTEEFGVDPISVAGIRLMSVAFFSGEAATPLRGGDVTNTLLELLAITRWGEVDLLVLDLPPGLGDIALDVVRLAPRTEFLLLGAASLVVVGSVRRALRLLVELRAPILGVAENLRREADDSVAGLAASFGVPFLGSMPYDPGLEEALGDPDRLRETALFAAVRRVAARVAE
ncbi:MAG: P-loop NTPase [Acidimicrobiia bacterium]|jgi:ATP-binding protein involved in chromosome partitioning|nr:P-loop NTPase [Acidimicrobiia bacterium]